MAPTSQKSDTRPIGFALEVDGDVVESITLALRPEDFTRQDTSRAQVHHTLGGAWVDNFGPGLPTLNIAGHTGWRGGNDGDGEARFRGLRAACFDSWHARRKRAIETGRDPSEVKLLYADVLNNTVVEVVPLSFTLRRSRSRPLLLQYAIAMLAVDQNDNQLEWLRGGRNDAGEQAGGFFDSVNGSIARIRSAIQGVRNWINRNLVAPVASFLSKCQTVFTGVIGITSDVRGLTSSALSVPLLMAQGGMNLMRTLAAVTSLPTQIRSQDMGVASAFSNVWCFLNRLRRNRLAYGDYSDFYGASNCSSISGGRPASALAGSNSFSILPTTASGSLVTATEAGRAGMSALAQSDPVLAPLNDNQLATHLGAIDQGVVAIAA